MDTSQGVRLPEASLNVLCGRSEYYSVGSGLWPPHPSAGSVYLHTYDTPAPAAILAFRHALVAAAQSVKAQDPSDTVPDQAHLGKGGGEREREQQNPLTVPFKERQDQAKQAGLKRRRRPTQRPV